MIFQRINRTAAERVFAVFRANEANVAADNVVQLDLTAASVDGVFIVQPNANEHNAVVGIADAAIANGAYGLVQIYGYRSTSIIHMSGSSMQIGAALIPIGGSDGLYMASNFTPASGELPSFVLLETLVDETGATETGTSKIFIRCM